MQEADAPIVILSYALGGHEQRSVVAAVLNGLEFTSASTQAIVHVSNASVRVGDSKPNFISRPEQSSGARERVVRTLSELARVWLNPHALATAKATPAVLAAHLSNFAVCIGRRALCGHAESRFVLLAANNVLFRPGLERVVHGGSLSFCVGNKCADPRGLSRDEIAPLAWRTPDGRSSPLRDEVLSAVARNADFEVAYDAFIAAFSFFVRGGHAGPLWAHSPVNFHSHEGAYYPVWMMREMYRAASDSPFGDAMRAQQAHTSPLASRRHVSYCSCCELYEPVVLVHSDATTKMRSHQEGKDGLRVCAGSSGNRTWWATTANDAAAPRCPRRPRSWLGLSRDSVHGRGACYLEELVLPTYAWQHHAALLVNATPPLVMRLWGSAFDKPDHVNKTGAGDAAPRLSVLRDVVSMVSSAPGFEHVVALKVPQRDFFETACAIFDTCANTPRASASTASMPMPSVASPQSTSAQPSTKGQPAALEQASLQVQRKRSEEKEQRSRQERQAEFEALMARQGTRFSGQATAEDFATPDSTDGDVSLSGASDGGNCHALRSLGPHIEGYNIAPMTTPRYIDSVFALSSGAKLKPPKPLRDGAPVAKVRGLYNSGTSWASNQLKALGFRLAGEEGLKAGSTPVYSSTNAAPSGLYGCWKHTPPWLLLGVYDIPEYLAPMFVTVAVVRHPLHWLASQLHKSYDIKCDDMLLGINCSFGTIQHGNPYSGNLKFCPGPKQDTTVYARLEDLWVRYVLGYRAYAREEDLPWLHRRRVLLVRHEDFVMQSPAEMRRQLFAGLVEGQLPPARSSMAKRETPLVSASKRVGTDSRSTHVDKVKGVLPVEASVMANLANSSFIRKRLPHAVLERVSRNAQLRAVARSLGYELLPC